MKSNINHNNLYTQHCQISESAKIGDMADLILA